MTEDARAEVADLRRARKVVLSLHALLHAPVPALITAALLQAVDERIVRLSRACIVFRRLGGDGWAIHYADDPPAVFECSLVGLEAAWLAFDDPGNRALRASDFCEPGAVDPARSVRRAIRETAADWIERRTGCRALASALRGINVARNGLITFEPAAGAARIVTR